MDKVTLKKRIKELLISKNEDGTYHLFGKFIIFPENDWFKLVNLEDEAVTYRFSSLKNAFTWCVFEKNQKYKELQRIVDLDESISSLEASITQYSKLLKKSASERKEILLAKITEERYKKLQATQEMRKYADISRYWQTKKYNENSFR